MPAKAFRKARFVCLGGGQGGGEGGGDEGGGRDASPHTAEQPVASAAHGAMPAMTPPLQFGYARRAMALALGPAHVPGKLDGVVAAAAM